MTQVKDIRETRTTYSDQLVLPVIDTRESNVFDAVTAIDVSVLVEAIVAKVMERISAQSGN